MSECPSNFDSEQVVPVAGGSIEVCDGREAETQNKERQQATESKIKEDASNAFFGFSKKKNEGLTGLRLCLSAHQIVTVNWLFLSLVVRLKIVMDEKQKLRIRKDNRPLNPKSRRMCRMLSLV